MDILCKYTGTVVYAVKGETLIRANLSGVNLSGAYLLAADLREADLYGASLREADLREADFRGADLRNADFHAANLHAADLREAALYGANLYAADLRNADLREAYLRGAQFFAADLRNADLREADLRGALLRQADLRGAKLPKAPVIEKIHEKVYAAASQPGALNMDYWHSCETTHCRAGWIVVLAGEAGAALEKKFGTDVAAALIYMASDTELSVIPDWSTTNAAALADMKRLAGR